MSIEIKNLAYNLLIQLFAYHLENLIYKKINLAITLFYASWSSFLYVGIRVVDSGRNTGFIGFLLNMAAVATIVSNYVIPGPLQYLLTYKLSQVNKYMNNFL